MRKFAVALFEKKALLFMKMRMLSNMWKSVFLGPTPAEARSFRDAVTADNIYRERILAAIILCSSFVLMIVDCGVIFLRSDASQSLSFMSVLFRISFCTFLVAFLLGTRGGAERFHAHHCLWDAAMVGVSLAWVGAFSGGLLVVRPGVEPYLIAVLIAGAFLYHDALRSILFLAVGFFCFILSALCFRPDFHVFLSSVVSVTLATLFAFFMSRIVFRTRLESFRDAQNIAGQRRIMQESVLRLQKLSYLDPLTGIANRRFLEMSLSREWKLEARAGQPLSVIMIDIDWFKLFNDTYGHIAGDDCMRQVAAALESAVRRPSDLVGRYGGEEFCVLLPMTDREGAIFTAKRIMQAIHELKIPHRSSPFAQVTVSMGIASRLPDYCDPSDSLVHAADTALYHAKICGKNRISWCCPVDMEQSPGTENASFFLHKSITLECPAGSAMESLAGTP
jgi:diguanylate cyclase (GGDEF)-like protein